MTLSDALVNSTLRRQVLLEGFKENEVNQFTAFLKEIDATLREQLSNTELTEFSRSRIEKLLKSVDDSLSIIFNNHYDNLAGHLTDLGEYEAELEASSFNDAISSKSFEAVIPAQAQIKAAIFSTPLSVRGADGGKLLEPFINDWSSNERKRLTGAIRQGFFEGQTNSQIKQTIRGTRANGYRDGLLAITSRNADAIVRTSVQHVASVSRFETWQENDDVVTGYRWVSTLDSRTSTQCKTLDGQTFALNKGPKPPLHIRCRSTTVAELDGRFDFLKEGQTRASKNGPVSANTTYYDWLKTQTPDFQKEALGATRAKLFREGGLSSKKFAELNLSKNFKPLTLAEMRKKEPLVFEKADEVSELTKQAQKAMLVSSEQKELLTAWVGDKKYQSLAGSVSNPRIKKQANEYGLSQEEQISLRHYTGTGYHDLNSVLRGKNNEKSAIILSNVDVLNDVLDKLPDYKGQVVRRDDLPLSILSEHRVGNVVTYEAFTSSTYANKDVFSDKPHRLVIDSISGKRVDWISEYATEKEVLFKSPKRFIVKSRRTLDNGIIEIRLQELPDD